MFLKLGRNSYMTLSWNTKKIIRAGCFVGHFHFNRCFVGQFHFKIMKQTLNTENRSGTSTVNYFHIKTNGMQVFCSSCWLFQLLSDRVEHVAPCRRRWWLLLQSGLRQIWISINMVHYHTEKLKFCSAISLAVDVVVFFSKIIKDQMNICRSSSLKWRKNGWYWFHFTVRRAHENFMFDGSVYKICFSKDTLSKDWVKDND